MYIYYSRDYQWANHRPFQVSVPVTISCIFHMDNIASLDEYNELASSLPVTTEVFLQEQRDELDGYNASLYGAWPGECLAFSMEIASSLRTPTARSLLNVGLCTGEQIWFVFLGILMLGIR